MSQADFDGQPYVKRAIDGSVRHLPDHIRGKGSSVIDNSGGTARIHQRLALLPAQRHHPQPAQQRHTLRRLMTAPSLTN
ncbi:hypothetical protein GCM10010503_38180 [Streptomyces lucensis JCM 4490]|uniref:Uncharacterized protein n=1 Tax=Streptomyces lucensis JCM 4490 TaxID=1306176 RepID=A0A918MSH8_9ACTN|nr:hypothetical protein [Streptomyces lucensis]GGW57199.1 hypothetical protein GCM10010503_38180 [Streptomyces lucensis JCM 4490]